MALRGDLHAHQEATDSNSVWEPPARTWHQLVDAQPQQVLLSQVQEMLHGVRLQARARAVSQSQVEHVEPLQEHVDAQEAWRLLDLAQEKSLRAQ